MRAHSPAGRWSFLATIVALLLLLMPATVLGQGIKDAVDDDPATEEATEEPFDPATGEATEEPFDPATEEATEEPFDPAEQAGDWEAAGLIDDQSYESPQFGYTLEWSRDWAVDVYYDPPVISDEDIEQDIVYLLWTGGPDEEAYAILGGQTANRGGPDGDVEEWLDPDFIEATWEPHLDVEALLDDTTRDAGAVLYSVVDSEDPGGFVFYTIYQSIELEDGTTLYLTFSAGEDVVEDAYASWASDLEVDGAPIEVVFDWDDIEAAI